MWEVRNNYWVDLSDVKKNANGYNWKESIGCLIKVKSDTEERKFLISNYERKCKDKRSIYITLMDYTGKQCEIHSRDILHGNLDSLFIQKD